MQQAATDGVTNPDGSPINVKFIMDAWLNQMGYPLLVVESNGDGTANVTSKRFFSPQDQSPDTPSNYRFVIINNEQCCLSVKFALHYSYK